jgi:amino acid adenylation domain-containing protein
LIAEVPEVAASERAGLSGGPGGPLLPTDYPRLSTQAHTEASIEVDVPEWLCAAMRDMERRLDFSLSAILSAALATLLHRYSGAVEFCIGSVRAADRIVLQVDFSGDPTYAQLLAQTKLVASAPVDPSSHDFSTTFALRSGEPARPSRDFGLPCDVALTAFAQVHRVTLLWAFNAELFERPRIERMAAHYLQLLAAVTADPDLQASRAPMMGVGERSRLITLGRGESRSYERDETVHELYARQARQTPGVVALAADGTTLTYEELDVRSNRLANYLRSLGVGPGASVGIALDRTVELPVGLLGILKAGAAYVPLDLSYPPERLRFITGDASLEVIVSDAASSGRLATCGARIVAVDAEGPAIAAQSSQTPHVERSLDAVAYIIYTSGSTGRAKGVAVQHRGVVRLVRNTNFIDVRADDVFLQFAPVAFDASTLEIWGPLLNGARLAVPVPGHFSIEELAETIEAFGVTTMWLTTTLFARVVESKARGFGNLRCLLTGGDVVSPTHARRFLEKYPACRLINGYGPTENTTFSTTYEVPSLEAIAGTVPIGKPIAHSSAYVLDRHMEPLPIGIPGELWVGGDGVARGYIGLDELTAERFVRDPFSDDARARLYRTGDRARSRADGVLEFLGRTDNQVKIRGFRIELGEIESRLRAHERVGNAAVVVTEQSGDKTLVAFVVSARGASIDERGLRLWLAEKLPAFMIPHRFVILDRLPEHASGKLDRIALTQTAAGLLRPVAIERVATPLEPVTPARAVRSGAELQIAIGGLWRDALGLDASPNIDANFFDAGGDSLLLLTVHRCLKEKLQISIGVMDLFEHTTIRALASFVGRNATH